MFMPLYTLFHTPRSIFVVYILSCMLTKSELTNLLTGSVGHTIHKWRTLQQALHLLLQWNWIWDSSQGLPSPLYSAIWLLLQLLLMCLQFDRFGSTISSHFSQFPSSHRIYWISGIFLGLNGEFLRNIFVDLMGISFKELMRYWLGNLKAQNWHFLELNTMIVLQNITT